jgi:serine protease inhibitor
MHRLFKLSLLVICPALLLQCSSNPDAPSLTHDLTHDSTYVGLPVIIGQPEKEIAQSANKFGLELFQNLNASNEDRDMFISPLSVSLAFGMAFNGAAGSTREAIQNTLELPGLSVDEINNSYRTLIDFLTGLDSEVIFEIANSIWYRKGFPIEQSFLDVNSTYFDAEIAGLDFSDPAAADIINAWVDEKTHGKIKDIVQPPIDPLTMLYLINAVYFYGYWTYAFDPEKTIDHPFHLYDGSETTCSMMYQLNEFPYLETQDFQAVSLPYGESKFNMALFLPIPDVDINELIARLTDTGWDTWINSMAPCSVYVQMPKFKLEEEYSLKEVLCAMGMMEAFSPETADFSNITKAMDLYISAVRHKTFVKVDEDGTEAAAVTIIEFGTTCLIPSTKYFVLDRPFIFAIYERESDAILFMGKLMKPVE